MPVLYVVATPIGNLEDITLRALRVLGEVGLIAAEDTRKTKRLLTRYGIKTPLTSYGEHNKFTKLGYLLEKLKEMDIALVSEAGTPGISDPGYELISAAIRQGTRIVPVPGPSAITAALAVSGLPTDRFTFIGFFPSRPTARRRLLQSLAEEPATIIALEAPHRLSACLEDILTTLGDRRLAIGRELTKIHEEIFRGSASEAMAYFRKPRGEFILVIEGKCSRESPRLTDDIEKHLRQMHESGARAKEAITTLAAGTGVPKKQLYQAWLRLGRNG